MDESDEPAGLVNVGKGAQEYKARATGMSNMVRSSERRMFMVMDFLVSSDWLE